ncbi:MAG TPA: hypothetical protein PLW68_05030 [Casimicrobiaceae bacterium]|nr:hypothetical protein [Casimicrobiaceae bacterium]
MSDENESVLSIKNLATMVPVVGIVLAAQYDVGFFNAVDDSLFTLFSWSDHIVFALQALLAAVLLLSVVGWSLSKFTFNTPLNQQPHFRLWILVVLFGLLAVGSAFAKGYDMMAYWILMSLVALSAIYLKVSLGGLLLTFSVSLVVLAQSFGYNEAKRVLRGPAEQLLVTSDSQLRGRVFRSGERGMLFFETSTRKMNFLRWDQVRRLEAIVHDSPSPVR